MIVGIGVDLVSLSRFSLNDERFINKILGDDELLLFNERKSDKRKLEFIAGRFAAKEAFFKALGTGIGVIPLKELQILADEHNKPCIAFKEYKVHVSITHTEQDACSFVVIEK